MKQLKKDQLLKDPDTVEGRYLIEISVTDTQHARTEADFTHVSREYTQASLETIHWQLYKAANTLQRALMRYECPHPATHLDSKGQTVCPDCERVW